jgi:cytochrome c-type biogenesis protein CcmH/NrfG
LQRLSYNQENDRRITKAEAMRSRSKSGSHTRWTFLFLALFSAAVPARAQVRVWKGTLTLPVYEEGNPDPNPPFDQQATTRFNYPYTLRTELTGERRNHDLRAIYLENEYLKCSVLPDIGGHVYTCIDKISGQPMFYSNPSLKKAQIGYRGAWAAFGVEFNFPVSHNWMSMSPVDFSYAKHDDGSASVTIGNIDRVYGMEWSVELVLRPGSTVLEQHVRLSNRNDVRQRFYWWSNAAVRVWDDSHIQYPMRYAAEHGFAAIQKWPVDVQGKDLSIIKNQTDGPVSLFVHGSREDFMGLWNPHSNTGTAHFAHYDESPAKKIWSWGVDADGLDWRNALSDDNSAYSEVQGGLFRNQETYAYLEPRQHISFAEYWMPVRDLGGISRANLVGIVHLERKNDSLVISLNANRKIPGATLRVFDGNKVLLSEKGNLAPDKTWTKSVPLPDNSRKYTFELQSQDATILLQQTEGQYSWTDDSNIKLGPQPNYVIPPENIRTEDDWLQAGDNRELNGDKLTALDIYTKALQKFPTSFELQKASGRILCSLKRFEDARPLLAAAHARSTTDAEVLYYWGMALEGIGKDPEALDAYEAAMRSPEHRAAAAVRIAEWKARHGNLQDGRKLVAASLAATPDDLRTLELQVALTGTSGDAQAATKQAQLLLQKFPNSAFLHEEADSPDLAHLAADPYRVTNVAAQYIRLGFYSKAIKVLSRTYPSVPSDQHEPGIGLPQDNPLVVYLLGYCREKSGESGATDYAHASKLSTLYVFPSTSEERAALEAALRANSQDAAAHYLLGTWFFARAMTNDALREWNEARDLDTQIPALNASLGWALLHKTHDTAKALSVFEQGIANDTKNAVNYSGAITSLAILGKPATQRVQVLERYPDSKTMPLPLVYDLALNKAEAGDFDGATTLFHNRFFGREEGGLNVRQVWIEVKLEQIQSLAKNGSCKAALAEAIAIGKPVAGLDFTQNGLDQFLNSARTKYRLAEAYNSCGEKSEASARFQQVAPDTELSNLVWASQAAKHLDGYDSAKWTERLTAGVSRAEDQSQRGNSKVWWMYIAGSLYLAIGQTESGRTELRDALLLPDSRMSHHYIRLALSESNEP